MSTRIRSGRKRWMASCTTSLYRLTMVIASGDSMSIDFRVRHFSSALNCPKMDRSSISLAQSSPGRQTHLLLPNYFFFCLTMVSPSKSELALRLDLSGMTITPAAKIVWISVFASRTFSPVPSSMRMKKTPGRMGRPLSWVSVSRMRSLKNCGLLACQFRWLYTSVASLLSAELKETKSS
ncbi:hypothetical protein TYRP_008769 [Tyrophagus putrescentiae]|nr:hypothetical protein TYRP_008769 [Tyrophagus putrescentiae]